MKKIRVGIIGAGIMGKLHARAAYESDREILVSVADLNMNSAKDLANEYHATYYDDYRVMLEQEEIDAVCIATPDFAHSEPVLDCLAANKSILVEKPLATSLEDSLTICEKVSKSNATVMVNYTHRWISSYAKAKEMIANGELGKPVMIYARKNDTIDVPLEMIRWYERTSPVKFLSSHDIDLALYLFDSDITEVYANGVKGIIQENGRNDYDAIQASVKFKNGAIGTFESSWIYPSTFPNPTDSYLQIVGDKGLVTLDRRSEGVEVASKSAYSYPKTSIVQVIDNKLIGAFKSAHDHFIECIQTGREPLTNAFLGHKVAEVTIAIHQSLQTGKPVSLPL